MSRKMLRPFIVKVYVLGYFPLKLEFYRIIAYATSIYIYIYY